MPSKLLAFLRDAIATIRDLVTSAPPPWVAEARRLTTPPAKTEER